MRLADLATSSEELEREIRLAAAIYRYSRGLNATMSVVVHFMKRMRLSTLMLLIVIAALSTALAVREWRDARQRARLAAQEAVLLREGAKLLMERSKGD